MPRRERFHPDFATDLLAATEYYDAISLNTGSHFRSAINSRLDHLLESPELYAEIAESARAARLPKFPYVIIYEIRSDVVYFVALVHGASEQKNWFTRIS